MPGQLTQSVRPSGQGGDFTSLSSWEAQNLNLVALDSASYVMIDGNWSGSIDSSQVYIDGWTTDALHSITIECVGTGSKHNGVWDDTKYRLEIEDSPIGCLRVGSSYITLKYLQIRNYNSTANGRYGINAGITTGSIKVEGCIVRGTNSSTYWDSPIYLYSSLYEAAGHVSNCLVYDLQTTLIDYPAIYLRYLGTSPESSSISNCTVYGNGTGSAGYKTVGSPSSVINCISQNCQDGFILIYTNITKRNNISDIPGDANLSGTVLFVDSASYNFQLSPYDTLALGGGMNLYTASNPITTDIIGTSRGNVSASYFDIGAFHSSKSIQTIKPTGQSGDYSSITSWEAQNQDLVSVNKSMTVYVDGDWSSNGPDDGLRIAGWNTSETNQLYLIVTGSARHNGYYDPTKYVNTHLTYGNPINLNTQYVTIDGFQSKITGSKVSYLEGIQIDGTDVGGYNTIQNCIVIDMHSGSGAAGNTGLAYTYRSSMIKSGSWYNNVVIGFKPQADNPTQVSNAFGSYSNKNNFVNNTIVDCFRGFYLSSGRIYIYNNILYNVTTSSYGFISGSHNYVNVGRLDPNFTATNTLTGSVYFTNSASYNYTIQTGSITVDAGINAYSLGLTSLQTDNTGRLRDSLWDIGAYELPYVISLTQSVAPSGGDFTTLSSWESQNLDLVKNHIKLYVNITGNWSGSTTDASTTVSGWVTDISRSIYITTDSTNAATATWDNTKYTSYAVWANQSYLTIKGIQAKRVAGIFGCSPGAYNYIRYENCFAWYTGTSTTQRVYDMYSDGPTVTVNCIAMADSASYGRGFTSANATHYFYNCSAYRLSYGFRRTNGTMRVVNGLYDNVGFNSYSTFITGTGSLGSDHGIFVDGANGNLHLAKNDPNIVGAATDLSTDTLYGQFSFNYDIDNVSRTGSWDIGAVTYITIPTPSPIFSNVVYRMAGFFFP